MVKESQAKETVINGDCWVYGFEAVAENKWRAFSTVLEPSVATPNHNT